MLITYMNLLDLTQSSALPSPTNSKHSTTFSSTTSSTSTTSAQSTSTPSSLGPSSSAVTNVDAIGGGVVGGLLGLFTLFVLLYGYIHWKRRIVRNGELLSSRTDTENPSMTQVQVINPRSESAIPSFVSIPNLKILCISLLNYSLVDLLSLNARQVY